MPLPACWRLSLAWLLVAAGLLAWFPRGAAAFLPLLSGWHAHQAASIPSAALRGACALVPPRLPRGLRRPAGRGLPAARAEAEAGSAADQVALASEVLQRVAQTAADAVGKSTGEGSESSGQGRYARQPPPRPRRPPLTANRPPPAARCRTSAERAWYQTASSGGRGSTETCETPRAKPSTTLPAPPPRRPTVPPPPSSEPPQHPSIPPAPPPALTAQSLR